MIISESRRAAEKNPLKNLTKKEALSEIYSLQKPMHWIALRNLI